MARFNPGFSSIAHLLRSSAAMSELITTEVDFEQAEKIRKLGALKGIDLTLAILSTLTAINCLIASLFLSEPGALLVLAATCGMAICGYTTAYWLIAHKHFYKQAAWLTVWVVSTTITVLYLMTGTEVPLAFAYLIPVTLIMLLFEEKLPLVIISLATFSFTVSLYTIQNFLKIYEPPLKFNEDVEASITLIILVAGTVVIGLMSYIANTSQVRVLKLRTANLQNALKELGLRQTTGQEVSQEVLSIAAQLTSVASQQAGGSQEQVATVTQVNSSVKELSATASQIKQIVYQVEKATTAMTQDSHEIASTTNASVEQAHIGLRTISETLTVSQQVAELYRELLVKTEQLADRSNHMRQILQLLDGISGETHLLSLNAAIEAAGAGQYGDRFGVVAAEIKKLSERSRKAGQDVAGIVEEISNFSQELRYVAQNGSNRADQLEAVAYQTGQWIDQLQKVAYQAQNQANSITKKAEEVENLTQIIHISTSQQSSASEQVLLSLNELLEVARQGASGSELVVNTARFLEDLSHTLTQALEINQTAEENFTPASTKILVFPGNLKTGS